MAFNRSLQTMLKATKTCNVKKINKIKLWKLYDDYVYLIPFPVFVLCVTSFLNSSQLTTVDH